MSDDSPFSPGDLVEEAKADRSELTTHSFIIKLWIEKRFEEMGKANWHGYITHVPSGQRRYLRDLDDILDFIIPYLESVPVRLGVYRWLKKWRNWKARIAKKMDRHSSNKSVEER